MISKPSGRRFVFEERVYTPHGRVKEWLRRIKEAENVLREVIRTQPPETYTIQVEVSKDDPRYDTAPIEEVWVTSDLVLTSSKIQDTYEEHL